MSPEKEVKIGISTGCLMGRSPELALRSIFQKREIAEALKAVNEIGLDGIELVYRRGFTLEKFQRVLDSLNLLENEGLVITVHAPLYYDRHSPGFANADSRFISWLLAYMSGFFKNEPAPQLAHQLKAPLVVHAEIIKALEEKGKTLKGKDWLVETEKLKPTREIIYQPEEVVKLAMNHELGLVFDTSRIGLANLPLRETWETYTSNGVGKVKIIHLSGAYDRQGRLIGGQIVHERFLNQRYLEKVKEFFQQVLRDRWQGGIIIEHAPIATSGKTYQDKRDQIKYTLAFLLANEIKPRRSYNLP